MPKCFSKHHMSQIKHGLESARRVPFGNAYREHSFKEEPTQRKNCLCKLRQASASATTLLRRTFLPAAPDLTDAQFTRRNRPTTAAGSVGQARLPFCGEQTCHATRPRNDLAPGRGLPVPTEHSVSGALGEDTPCFLPLWLAACCQFRPLQNPK